MSDPAEKNPIIRYSDLAQEKAPANGDVRNGGVAARPAEIAFRAIDGLKPSGGAESPLIRAQTVMPDSQSGDLFRQATREMHVVYEGVRQGHTLRIEPLFALAEIIAAHPAPDQLIRQIFEDQKQAPTAPHRNAATCGIIAAQVARGLGYQKDDLVQLTVAALLHDIGVEQLPLSLLEKPGKLSDEEFKMVQTHPELGYRILHKDAPGHPLVAQIVRQEHERETGQGYPNKLDASAILEPAKVIGVTDIYDALITPRPYRKAFCPHEAIQELIECQERMGYARHVVRALVQQLSLFPTGCLVRLSSNEVGRVIQTNNRSPLRPVVEVLYADQVPLAVPRIVDLNENPLLHIVTSLCPSDHPANIPDGAQGSA